MRSLRGRVKAVGTYIAERREADRFQPEGWETVEGRALLSQYRAEMNDNLPPAQEHTPAAPNTSQMSGPVRVIRGVARVARQLSNEITAPIPLGRGVARVIQRPSNEVAHRTNGHVPKERARHASDEVAVDTNHRARHDGTQSRVDSSYLLTRPPATEHGVPVPAAPAETARVLTITNVVRGPDGHPLAGAIVTISLLADHSVPGFRPIATIDGVARIVTAEEGTWSVESTGRAIESPPVTACEESG